MAKRVISMPTCHSSNDMAQELAQKADTVEGTVVICGEQTSGKGQRGNTWEAKAGQNLTLSVILRPKFLSVKQQFYLNMITSLAVKQALGAYSDHATSKVKWPNDVLFNNKKIAGILIENTLNRNLLDTTVVGIGLNVNQVEFFAPKATSLAILTGQGMDLSLIFENLMLALERQYLRLKAGKQHEIKRDYLSCLFGYREKRKYIAEYRFEGTIEDVTDEGRLLITGPQGRRTYDLKEIEFVY